VEHRASFSTLNASYDNFLFAPVCEEANGMRLSVLSALARANVDPWDEAAHLTSMPREIAEKTLLSIFDLVSGKSWKSPEAAAIVARLVRLLPRTGEATAAVATPGTATSAKSITSYWWVWVGFALAMAFMTPHHDVTSSSTDAVTTESGATAPVTTTAQFNSGNSVPDPVEQSR
jgi:hypothetical protein